jgi:uncharacterized protein (DUF362 family)
MSGDDAERADDPRAVHLRPGRRQILQQALTGVVLAGGSLGLGHLLYRRAGVDARAPTEARQVRDFRVPKALLPDLVVAKSSLEPEVLTRRAVTALGGMGRFVSRGDIVAIKPNIGWDRTPAQAANTNPRVVAEVVRLCLEAGAHRVVVTDASCNEARRSFQRSGIWRAAHEAGAEVLLPAEHRFREMRIRGELLDRWPVYKPLIEADKVINVPIAKHHNLSSYTGAMKNWYGVLGGRRNRLHQNIHLSVADLATFMRPTLTVLDATRVLLRNGPQGGNLADARDLYQVVAGTDEIAIDTYGASLIGVDPTRVGYLLLGQARGLGRMHSPHFLEV